MIFRWLFVLAALLVSLPAARLARACSGDAECVPIVSECLYNGCIGGSCQLTPKIYGTTAPTQTDGDCMVILCDGYGGTLPAHEPSDPPPGETCPPPCRGDDTCANQDDGCRIGRCTEGVCHLDPVLVGTPTALQMPGDCGVYVCDGHGNVVLAEDLSDAPPDDGNTCTIEMCPAPIPAPPGVPCPGGVCDGAGVCVPPGTGGGGGAGGGCDEAPSGSCAVSWPWTAGAAGWVMAALALMWLFRWRARHVRA